MVQRYMGGTLTHAHIHTEGEFDCVVVVCSQATGRTLEGGLTRETLCAGTGAGLTGESGESVPVRCE